MMQPSPSYEIQAAPPQAAAVFGAMANMQSKLSELEKIIQSQHADKLALDQLLRERAEKPSKTDELWIKIAKALSLTFSLWGVTCFVPLDRERGVISITLLLALIRDCFITREALHKLFEPMRKPTEDQVYSISLPVKYQTVQEAVEDLYIIERFQVEHALSLQFQTSPDRLEDAFRALTTFIKQSPQLLNPPHIRLEHHGVRSDFSQEHIGKPISPQSMARWGEYMGVQPSHFHVQGSAFVPVSPAELETFHSAPLPEQTHEPAPQDYTYQRPSFQFGYQPTPAPYQQYHHQYPQHPPQPNYPSYHQPSANSFPPEAYNPPHRYHEEPPYRPSTVQVSEVVSPLTACERFIESEGMDAFRALQKEFPDERFSLLNDKEFKAIARKHVSLLKKRKREPEEKPKARGRKRTEKKTSRKKSSKKLAPQEEEEEEEEEEDHRQEEDQES
jgi:hypothetical protein